MGYPDRWTALADSETPLVPPIPEIIAGRAIMTAYPQSCGRTDEVTDIFGTGEAEREVARSQSYAPLQSLLQDAADEIQRLRGVAQATAEGEN